MGYSHTDSGYGDTAIALNWSDFNNAVGAQHFATLCQVLIRERNRVAASQGVIAAAGTGAVNGTSDLTGTINTVVNNVNAMNNAIKAKISGSTITLASGVSSGQLVTPSMYSSIQTAIIAANNYANHSDWNQYSDCDTYDDCDTYGDCNCYIDCDCYGDAGSCFEADALVLTPDGEVPISMLQVGQRILGYSDGKVVEADVLAVIVHEPKVYEILHVKFEDGSEIKATPEHLVYVVEDGWKPLSECMVGEHLLDADGHAEPVWFKWSEAKEEPVYNLTTSTSNYFVNGKLVHNAKAA